MNLEQARFNMIEQQIRPWDVLDQKVLGVVADTPRELFVPETQKQLAFVDMALPLGHDEFMMEPKLEARLLQSLSVQPQDMALEIGTGSGYLTACLAKLANHVHSVEIHEDFKQSAQQRLDNAGIKNATLWHGDAAFGWSEQPGKYDVIAVTGSLPDYDDCFEQMLNAGGRLFMVVGDAPAMQAMLVTRSGSKEFDRSVLFETAINPLAGRSREPAFKL